MALAPAPAGDLPIGAIADPDAFWKSLCGRKATCKWDRKQCERLAALWFDALPGIALDLVRSGRFKGGALIKISSPVKVSIDDVENNYVWLKCAIALFKDRIASMYFYADSLLMLDELLDGNLLVATDTTPKAELALQEANNLKRVHGRLRELFRGAQGSYSKKIRDLKETLQRKTSLEKSTAGSSSATPVEQTTGPAASSSSTSAATIGAAEANNVFIESAAGLRIEANMPKDAFADVSMIDVVESQVGFDDVPEEPSGDKADNGCLRAASPGDSETEIESDDDEPPAMYNEWQDTLVDELAEPSDIEDELVDLISDDADDDMADFPGEQSPACHDLGIDNDEIFRGLFEEPIFGSFVPQTFAKVRAFFALLAKGLQIHSFTRSLVHSFFCNHSFTRSFLRSFIHSSFHSFSNSSTHSCTHDFVP
jgi:hypothetical protein